MGESRGDEVGAIEVTTKESAEEVDLERVKNAQGLEEDHEEKEVKVNHPYLEIVGVAVKN